MGEPSLQSGMAILTMGKEPCFSGKRAVILPQGRKGCIRELGRYSWNTCSSWGHWAATRAAMQKRWFGRLLEKMVLQRMRTT